MNTVEEDQKIIDAMRAKNIEEINVYLWDQRLDKMTREQLVDAVVHFYNKCEYLKSERNKLLQDKVKLRDILNSLKDEEEGKETRTQKEIEKDLLDAFCDDIKLKYGEEDYPVLVIKYFFNSLYHYKYGGIRVFKSPETGKKVQIILREVICNN